MRPQADLRGPTLSPAEARRRPTRYVSRLRARLDCLGRPAVRSGRDLVIDGGFQSEPAVRHKEILWALAAAFRSSAPPAWAPCVPPSFFRTCRVRPHLSMVPPFRFAPDDAVAVLHGPGDVNFAPLTHALIDLRMTLRAAERRGVVSRRQGKAGAAPHRLSTFASVRLEHVRPGLSDERGRKLRFSAAILPPFIHQKKRDAQRALELLRDEVFTAPPLAGFQLTAAFTRDLDEPE